MEKKGAGGLRVGRPCFSSLARYEKSLVAAVASLPPTTGLSKRWASRAANRTIKVCEGHFDSLDLEVINIGILARWVSKTNSVIFISHNVFFF